MSHFFWRWFSNPAERFRTKNSKKRTTLKLISLEDRTVPATWDVTSLAASGSGSLQAAITSASTGDTINIETKGTIELGSVLTIGKNLTINGLGASQDTINGQGITQIFNVSTANTALTLNGLTLTGGRSANNGGAIYTLASTDMLTIENCVITSSTAVAGAGGAILAGGDVSITGSTISGNTAKTTGGAMKVAGTISIADSTISNNIAGTNGGGINAGLGLTVVSSTISGNTASTGDGGGIVTSAGDTITNSTIAYNAARYGGGIFMGGQNVGTVVTDSTVAGNKAKPISSTGGGGGIFDGGASDSLYLRNSIVAGNTDTFGAAPDISSPTSSTTTSVAATAVYSLVGSTAGTNVSGSHDISNVSPKLGPLQNNGGNVQTMALLAGSPAINAGSNSLIPSNITTDERGAARIMGGTVDIGAVEIQPISVTTLTSSASTVQVGHSVTFKATITSSNVTSKYTPSGTVTFFVNGVAAGTVTVSSGAASFTTSSLAGGIQTITAVFNPADGSVGSQTSFAEIVQTPTVTSLATSAPSAVEGQTLSFTATVTATTGTPVTIGTVDFYANGTYIGAAALNAQGQAVLTTTANWTGSPVIEVVFVPPGVNPSDLTGSSTSLSQILSGAWIFARRRT